MSTKTNTLTQRGDRTLQRLAGITLFIVAVAAAVQSWSHLTSLAMAAGVSSSLAWLYPVTVDGLIAAGTLGVWFATVSGIRTTYPWGLVVLGSGLSVYGNIASSDGTVVAVIVHATPAVVLIAVVEVMMSMRRNGFAQRQAVVVAHEAAEAAEAARIAEEQERQARAAQRVQEAEERAARRATKAGLSDTATKMRQVLPRGDISLTDGAIAIVQAFPGRLRSADVAAALACSPEQALRAVSRARAALKAMEATPEPEQARERVLAAV